jgi:hypothetical protein
VPGVPRPSGGTSRAGIPSGGSKPGGAPTPGGGNAAPKPGSMNAPGSNGGAAKPVQPAAPSKPAAPVQSPPATPGGPEVRPGQVGSAWPKGRRVGGRKEGVRPTDPPAGRREEGAWDLTPENQRRMERGRPPIGRDGREVELHHRDQNPRGPLDEVGSRTHDGIPHPKRPSTIDREKFAGERRRYWIDRIRELMGQK